MKQERGKSPTNQRFSTALWDKYHSGTIPVIPDIKTSSPGEGDLLQGRDPVELARTLESVGAPAISVVTEPQYFGGSLKLLQQVARAVSIPILRKDFINNRTQLSESIDLGAAAVLLIAAMLQKDQLFKLVEEAWQLGLEPLVEIHNETELAVVSELRLPLLGINNRNIVELETDDGNVTTTERLAGLVQPGTLIISESSITDPEDVNRAITAGTHAVLVGTALMQADDMAEMFRDLSEPVRYK
ncbi:MAG: indole-3-glycerol-phosphate synthase [Syntrophomonadaceae bacterium]|jgi:indole-3-glycerol phosphate synthase